MFGYRSSMPKVRLTTDRLVACLVHDRDAWRLTNYYAENKVFLKPWEPIRDGSHCYLSGRQAHLSMIGEFHKQGSAFYFALLDAEEKEIASVTNFSNIVRGPFHTCHLDYSIGEEWQGQGLVFEALTAAIRYMQCTQHIRRIVTNYISHNQRNGALLARLRFEKGDYAKDHLLINRQWRGYVLTALTAPDWSAGRQRKRIRCQLTAHEARIIGCLLEKQVTAPEQYPLSVDAVVTTCNQRTNREPVISLSEGEVQTLLDTLVKRHYLRTVSGFNNRVTEYEQHFCNSEFGDLKLSTGEVAVMTTLLLRGAQTPSELRGRAQWMHKFNDMAEVESVLEGLTTHEDGPSIARLPWGPGEWENRYMHLFCDDMDTLITTVEALSPLEGDDGLRARVEALKGKVAELKARLDSLLHHLED